MSYQNEWEKANCTKKTIKFNTEKDKDILDKLSSVPSIVEYIRNLIREDIKKGE